MESFEAELPDEETVHAELAAVVGDAEQTVIAIALAGRMV
jgi:hypothetical protein